MPGTSPGMTVFVPPEEAYSRPMSLPSNQVGIGAGPAGLMAAEVLAQGGAGHRLRRDALGWPQVADGRARRTQPHAQRTAAHIPLALPRGDATSESGHRSVSAAGFARLERSAGQETFIGSSGRVFPKAFKASPLLRAWLRRLDSTGVKWRCVTAGPAGTSRAACAFKRRMDRNSSRLARPYWRSAAQRPRLGSDGTWAETLAAKGVQISPLRPANSGFIVAWSDIFRDRFEGQPLKGVALAFGAHRVRGEAIVTRTGIEGGAVYALSAELRETIIRSGQVTLRVALRPDLDMKDLIAKVSAPKGKQSLSNFLRKAVIFHLLRSDCCRRQPRHPALRSHRWRRPTCQPDQRRPDRAHRYRPDRARHFDRGRDRVRRTRFRFHAPPLARRVCGGRDAGLGSANRRLSAAGVIRDGRGGGAGRVEVA